MDDDERFRCKEIQIPQKWVNDDNLHTLVAMKLKRCKKVHSVLIIAKD